MSSARRAPFLRTRTRRVLALCIPFLLFCLLLVVAERLLRLHYYGRTYRFYDVGEVYWEDASTMLLFRSDRYLFWKPKAGIRLRIEEEPEQYSLYSVTPTRVPYRFTVETNSRGYRTPEFSASKPRDTFRIVVLGDSRTIGEGVPAEALYSRRLEKLLNERRPGSGVEVINIAVFGYSSEQGRVQLRREALDWDPDLVTILFGVNDQDRWEGISDVEKARRFDSPAVTLRAWLDRSMIVYFVRRQGLALRGAIFGKTPARPNLDEHGRLGERRVSLERYERNLRDMIELCRARGAEPLLLIVPASPYVYYPSLFDDDLRALDAEALQMAGEARVRYGEGDYSGAAEILRELVANPYAPSSSRFLLGRCYQQLGRFEEAHREMVDASREIVFARYARVAREVAERDGVHLVDLTPEFRTISRRSYYVDDMHPNEYGQELIAEKLAATILGAGLLDGPGPAPGSRSGRDGG